MGTKTNSALIAAAVVVAGAAGGYFYLTAKITDAVETAFRDLPAQNENVIALSHGGLDVDLLGDRATLSNVTAKVNLALGPRIQDTEVEVAYATIHTDGILALAFGGQTIGRIEMMGGTMTTTMVGKTLEEGYPEEITAPVTIKTDWSMIEDLDFSQAFDGAALKPLWYQNLAYKAFDTKDMTGEMDISTASNEKNMPSGITFRIDRTWGHDISMERVGEAKVEGFTFDATGADGQHIVISLDDLAYRNIVMIGGMAVSAETEFNGLTLDPGDLADPETAAMMQALGIDKFTVSSVLNYAFDLDKRTFVLDMEHMTLDGFGKIAMGLELSSLPPRDLIEKFATEVQQSQTGGFQQPVDSPTQAEMAAAAEKVALDRFHLSYQDLGIVRSTIATMAANNNMSTDVIAQGFAEQGAMAVVPFVGADKAPEAQAAITTFLSNPGAITLAMDPGAPVVLTALSNALEMQGPQALEPLNLTLTGSAAE